MSPLKSQKLFTHSAFTYRQVHLWVQRQQPVQSLNHKLADFELFKYNFNRTAKRCLINLEVKREDKLKKCVTCSVAQALEEYIRPGLLLSPAHHIKNPREFISKEISRRAEKPKEYLVDACGYIYHEAAIPLYVLRDITKAKPKLPKRGGSLPWMIFTAWDSPLGMKAIMTNAFRRLNLQGVSSFTFLPRYAVVPDTTGDAQSELKAPKVQYIKNRNTSELAREMIE